MFVLNSWLTPPERKPRKFFSIISGTDISKLPIWAKYTSGPEKLPPDASGLNLCSQFRLSQPEGVTNDGYGTQAHGRARDDGTQEQTEEWIEQTRRDGDSERVIGLSLIHI